MASPKTGPEPVPPCYAALLNTLSSLRSLIRQFHYDAGPNLENFSRLKPADISTFETDVEVYWHLYAEAIYDALSHGSTSPGISILGVIEMLEFTRQFAYAKAGRRLEPLRSLPLPGPGVELHCMVHRLGVAARMYWLQCHEKEGRDVYAMERRYEREALELDSLFLENHLEDRYKWLVDWTVVLTWETWILLENLWTLMWNRYSLEALVQQLWMKYSAEARLQDYTVSATIEAMTGRDERNQKLSCSICEFNFGPMYSEDVEMEPAVKTLCNHIFGRQCLQAWVDSGRTTCPSCRQKLFSLQSMLPPALREDYNVVIRACQELDNLDERIDDAVKEGNIVMHAEGFADVIKDIERLTHSWDRYYLRFEIADFTHSAELWWNSDTQGHTQDEGERVPVLRVRLRIAVP